MPANPGAQKLYLLYVQATKDDKRRQYMIFPPHTGEINGFALATSAAPAYVMSRKQESAAHRASWEREVAPTTDTSYAKTLSVWTRRVIENGWELSPLILVELLPEEYKAVLDKEKEAHHRLLSRVERVANRVHRLTI